MVEVKNLCAKIGKKEIIHNVSFKLFEGERTILLGRNGSGKTTLIKALSSALPYDGSIKYNNEELRELSSFKKALCHSLMPQTLPSPSLTVRELLEYSYTSVNGNINFNKIDNSINSVLNIIGFQDFEHRIVSSLSGGERQMVFWAFSLIKDSMAYYLDEPEAALAPNYLKTTSTILKKLKEQNKIVLTSMHHINRALSIADKLLVLDSGNLIFSGSPNEFKETTIAKEVFSMELKVLHDDNGKAYELYF